MQNPDFLRSCLKELGHRVRMEVVEGDRYHPVWAIRIDAFTPPDAIVERTVDIVIPMARCAGYFPGTSLAGLHVSRPLHGVHEGETTLIPFCDPVVNADWMVKMARFYPVYEHHAESLVGTSYICLNDPHGQPDSPAALLDLARDYLNRWWEHASTLANHHGAVVRGMRAGDEKISADWVDHLVENVAPGVKEKLLRIAYPE